MRRMVAGWLMLWSAVAATAQPKVMRDRDFVAMEAEALKQGWRPFQGLAPPDSMVPRLVWQQAPLADVPAARHPLRLATAAERLGHFALARQRWGAILGDAGADAAARSEAEMALVRLNLVHDPAAARALLNAMPADARSGYAARVLEGRLLVMEGRPGEALAMLEQQLPAAIRTSGLHMKQLMDDLALAAHLAGQADYAVRLQSMGSETPGLKIAVPLLQCDPDQGLRPDDRAVVDFSTDMLNELSGATLVWASRPGLMAGTLVQRALEGRAERAMLDLRAGDPARQRIMLACAPHDILPDPDIVGSMVALVASDGSLNPVPALAALSAMPPPNSPMVALARVMAADVPPSTRAAMLLQAIAAVGATPDLCGAVVREADRDHPLSTAGRLAFAAALKSCRAPVAAAAMLERGAEDMGLSDADRRGLAARALELSGEQPVRQKMAEHARLAPDDCLLADIKSLAGLEVSADDYPPALRRAAVEGMQWIAFDRAADGATGNVRVLLAQPPLLFDAATVATIERNRPAPAMRGGTPMACTGYVSRFRWQLQEAD